MKPEEDDWDEALFSSLIHTTDHEMPAPDPEFLARLRERSTQAFVEAAAHAFPAGQDVPPRRRSMLSLALKAVSACVAAGVVVAAGLWSFFAPHESQVVFGAALDRVAAANTLHLTITRDGQAGEVWYAQPNLLRWDAADGTYKIARGNTLWRVDETQNLAATEPAALFGTDAAQRPGVDLLSLLDLNSPEARSAVARQAPVETIERDGRKLLHYRFDVPGQPEQHTLDALVDLKSQMVESCEIQALRNGRLETVAALNVVAVNLPVADEKFVVRDTLTEDGRIGKIADVEGLVSIKPVMHQRWTAVCSKTLLKLGDWVRTDNRGANAAMLKIVKQSQVILGPGSLVEFVSPTQIRVTTGEFEVTVGEKDTLDVVGPGDEKVAVQGTQIFRVKNEKLARLEKEPLWLKGFKGTANAESIGSLIAKVDGRSVPLTVGYHKVTVDIRDQIARTVIEESFVNHTNRDLEGVFYFPLPDDASISGFGMWIGDELVEADVVEKQRAREIYETILRERRDPGLLEWTGGNIFKARVFPIFGNSEKRIKISYTQVLPARGNSYRYSYALQSELLKLNPLRELSIDVKVNSAVPLKNISSPTHTVRTDKTARSAHVEFTAQDYTPTRDFEVVVDTEGKQSDVVLIPHRRGDDGYFMLQLTPPATGDWQREVLPDGEPLQLLILADTSASIDAGQRRRQQEVVAALLTALTPRDTINLAGCDAECDWVFEKSMAAEPKNLAAIRSFLEKRHSLGWTDLDGAFASAFKQAGPKTHIVYLGDGIVTTGDARPDGFARRVKQAYRAAAGTCHAVALGSSFEPAVLKAIASLGSGSLRRISGEDRPQIVATALLREMAQPGLRDLKIEFRGLETARVYPEELANIPVGSQQILLGLYRPSAITQKVADKGGADQTGEVVVTATQNGKPVKFAARVSLKDAEEGNSFIPRMWAKMHLESLLAQGASSSIRDEIIALSEEFQIMTPYTSFLVLESDADRERFKVKRRFRMRDGEKYFQEGRDNASFELVQKQMQRAGNWRLGLRRMALKHLATLGRNARLFQVQSPRWANGPYGGPASYTGMAPAGMGGGWGGGGMGGGGWDVDSDGDGYFDGSERALAKDSGILGAEGGGGWDDDFKRNPAAEPASDMSKSLEEVSGFQLGDADALSDSPESREDLALSDAVDESAPSSGRPDSLKVLSRKEQLFEREFDFRNGLTNFRSLGGFGFSGYETFGRAARGGRYRGDWNQPDYVSWVNTLFPALPPAAELPKKVKPPKITWPDAARALSQSLLRTGKLAQLDGGLEIARAAEGYEARWNELISRQQRLDLYAKGSWLTRTEVDSSQTLVNWADATERGVMGLAFHLGRLRKSAPSDLTPVVLGLDDHSLAPLHETYREYTPTVEQQEENRTLLILKLPRAPKYEMRIVIDTTRHVIVSIEQRNDGKLTTLTKFDDFVEVAGSWWARRIEMTDEAGRRTSLVKQTVEPLAADAFTARLKMELAPREQVQFVHLPLPTVVESKRAQARLGRLTFDSQLVLLLHFAQSQQWTKVIEQLEACERLSVGKPGVRWIRNSVLSIARRHEELKGRLADEAAKGVEGAWKLPGQAERDAQRASGDEMFLAEYLLGQAGNILEANEQMKLHGELKPLYERQPAYRKGLKGWKERRVGYLQMIGQPDTALREMRQLAVENPRDWNLQQRYAQMLFNTSDVDTAYDWLAKTLADNANRQPYEEDNLRSTIANSMHQQGRYAELADYYGKWVERSTENPTLYQQYLSALIQADQVAKSDALLAEWLKAGTVAGELSPAVSARLSGAIWVALRQGYYIYTDRIDEKWLAPLADVVLATARSERELTMANQIMRHWRFAATDECRRVRREITKLLAADVARLSPDRLNQFISWIMPNDPAVPAESWQAIAKALKARWSAEEDPEVRHQLAAPLVQVLTHRIGTPELLDFLRLQLAEGPERYRATYANQLFDTLIAQPWSAPVEDEAFALLERLSDAEEPADRLFVQVAALYRLTDAMVNARNHAGLAKIEHLEQLKRNERREKTEEQLQLARQGFADRLKQEMHKHQGALVPWLNVERLYLDTLTKRNLAEVAGECWEALPARVVPRPAPPEDEDAADRDDDVAWRLDRALRHRYLSTLAYLATRKGADAALVERLLKFVDQHLAAELGNGRWKVLKYELLLALDRPKDLKEALTLWMKADDADSRWRLTLGYLLAELGSVPEAIALFEGTEVADELGPQAYAVLADWYLAANRREAYERARIRVYLTLDEWRMNQWLYAQLAPWQRSDGHLPSELDSEVLLMFSALFEKSSQPQNYLSSLQQFYQATHDFRLLAVLADSIVGHTAAKVYPFVQGMQPVLSEIRDEATADQLKEQIVKVRERARTAVDRRALDLLEVQVERRAAEVQNQPGPHVAAALAALRRAFEQEWSTGEQRLMADFLAGLQMIYPKALADEQLRQLGALYDLQTRGTYDRLHIGHRLAELQWSYARTAQAIDVLQGALTEYQGVNEGVLPVSANNALATFVYYLDSQRHFARAEKIVNEQLRHPVHGQQRLWLVQKLYEVYDAALRNGGEVSIGSGKTLYKAYERVLLKELETTDQNHRHNVVNRLCAAYRTARELKLPGVGEDLTVFATRIVPEVLKQQTSNYTSVVSQVAATLHDVVGVRAGLAFLIERIEHEPGWFRYSNQDGWSQFASTLETWRFEMKNVGDLDGRLLKIVLAELRRDLESQQQRNRVIYYWYHGDRFWKEKADEFARVADEVYAKRKASGAAVQYIADYLFHGLGRKNRAIEILFIASRDKVLDEAGRSKLVDFLHLENRYGESIALLEPLVDEHPENLNYRIWLMHACFRTNRKAELLALLKQSDEFFHKDNRWSEYILQGLAASCLQNQLFEECARYYGELIPLHQQTQPHRGIGNGTLSGYYSNQAEAYAGLKLTGRGVEAACGAIISWGPTHANRVHAVETLKNILRRSPDLAAYTAELDKETESNNEDRPIVRKALGQVLLEQGKFPLAIAQLQRAVALEPNDIETHKALIAGYDKVNDKDGAVRQILESLEVIRRDIALFHDLGNRFIALERPREAERAYTSIVEAQSSESESHALLAEIRQKQNRWPEAIEQWEEVARIRVLEPAGLIGLAGAQIHEKQWDAARETLRQLNTTTWPVRFAEALRQVQELEKQMKAARDQ